MKQPIRQFERSPGETPIEVNGVSGRTFELSEGGFSAEIRASVRPGSNVYGWIDLNGKHFDYTGRVIWSGGSETGARRFGIRFSGVEHAYFDALHLARPAHG